MQEEHGSAGSLAAAIDAYRRAVEQLSSGWDMEIYAGATDKFSAMQAIASACGFGHAAWAQVVITRFEFTQALWHHAGVPQAASRVRECYDRHVAALRELRARCGR